MTRSALLHRLALGLGFAASVGLASEVQAAVPRTLMHQGRLFDAEGVPVNAILRVAFAVYAAPDDPMPLWTETIDVAFDDGYFSASLGDISPIDETVFDGSTRYLGVTVGADPEIGWR